MADEMKKLRVGCYGAKGSYTYEAMERQFGEREREEHYYPLFEDVLKLSPKAPSTTASFLSRTPRPAASLKSMTSS